MRKFFREFKEFAVRGNVLDLAVGVIIGTAFGKIVSSLVDDIIMPPIGKLVGNVDFRNLFVTLDGKDYATLEAARAAGTAAPIAYGQFINIVLNFAIVAFCVFLVVKTANALRRMSSETEVPPAPSEKECPYCLSKIPLLAVRCSHCTSHLEERVSAPPESGGTM